MVHPDIRNFVLERDKNTCQKCGSNDRLQVHHLIPKLAHGSDEVSNLVTLCIKCHNMAHHVSGRCHGRMLKTQQATSPTNHIKISFDACINSRSMFTIPYATRIKHDLEPGDVLTFEVVSTKKRLEKKEAKA